MPISYRCIWHFRAHVFALAPNTAHGNYVLFVDAYNRSNIFLQKLLAKKNAGYFWTLAEYPKP